MGKHTYFVPSSFFLTNLKLEDMRPKENFNPGDVVDCVDRPRLHDGKLIRIDCDNRLGLVEWPDGKTGWWYLKDLVIVGWPMVLNQERAYGRTPISLLEIASAVSASQ